MNLTSLKQKLLTLLKSPQTLQELSTKRLTICPAERRWTPPAIFLEDDLDKVTGLMDDTNWEQERLRIHGGEIEHAATMAYTLQNCELLDGNLYKDAARLRLTQQPRRLVTEDIEETIPEAALAATYYGSFYFGHWLTDDLTLYLAAESMGQPIKPARRAYSHEPGYLELLQMRPYSVKRARFAHLTLFDDIGQNSYKLKRYQQIRERLRKGAAPANAGGKIMIRRGQLGAARVLTNAEQIEQLLLAQGFSIINPETSSVHEIVSALLDARLVVGLEGSQMLHAFYAMSETGGLCVLQPPNRFNNVLKNYTDCLGIRYGFVTGKADAGGFNINPNELMKVLDKIDSALAAG